MGHEVELFPIFRCPICQYFFQPHARVSLSLVSSLRPHRVENASNPELFGACGLLGIFREEKVDNGLIDDGEIATKILAHDAGVLEDGFLLNN